MPKCRQAIADALAHLIFEKPLARSTDQSAPNSTRPQMELVVEFPDASRGPHLSHARL
jgi:hypothetical protein